MSDPHTSSSLSPFTPSQSGSREQLSGCPVIIGEVDRRDGEVTVGLVAMAAIAAIIRGMQKDCRKEEVVEKKKF